MTDKYGPLRKKLEVIIQAAAFIGVILLILSPIIQWIERIYLLMTGKGVIFSEYTINIMGDSIEVYQEMMRSIQSIVSLLSKIIAGSCLIYVLLSVKKFNDKLNRWLIAAIPLIIFACYAAAIYLVTEIRGETQFDKLPNYYLGDTIFEFMRHPFTYFFCGIFVLKDKLRKVIAYTLTLSATVLNAAALIDWWIVPNRCFTGKWCSAIFNNPNHYSYYLAISIICMGMLFIYEKKALYKTFLGACFALGMTALIAADSLGSYLAVAITVILIGVYCFLHERDRLGSVLVLIAIMIAINLMLSMLVDTLFSSIIRTFFDVGRIISDPTGSDNAGTRRWGLWKAAVKLIAERPLTGWGIEGYEEGETAHCEPLQYGVNFGIPVVVLHLTAIATVMVETFIKKKKLPKTTLLCFCCTFTYLVGSMVGVAIFYTTPFMYVFLGLTYAEVAKSFVGEGKDTKISTDSAENSALLNEE